VYLHTSIGANANYSLLSSTTIERSRFFRRINITTLFLWQKCCKTTDNVFKPRWCKRLKVKIYGQAIMVKLQRSVCGTNSPPIGFGWYKISKYEPKLGQKHINTHNTAQIQLKRRLAVKMPQQMENRFYLFTGINSEHALFPDNGSGQATRAFHNNLIVDSTKIRCNKLTSDYLWLINQWDYAVNLQDNGTGDYDNRNCDK